jgi:ribonucleotide monophosphatase NagD (HAD superfamily)
MPYWYCTICSDYVANPHRHKGKEIMTERSGPTVLVDFDGVIHKYGHGWWDGTAYDIPFDGAKDGLKELEALGYTVVIFSSRDRDQIREWLRKYDFEPYEVTNEKRTAVAIIDDRAIRFLVWRQAIDDLKQFYPIVKSKED